MSASMNVSVGAGQGRRAHGYYVQVFTDASVLGWHYTPEPGIFTGRRRLCQAATAKTADKRATSKEVTAGLSIELMTLQMH